MVSKPKGTMHGDEKKLSARGARTHLRVPLARGKKSVASTGRIAKKVLLFARLIKNSLVVSQQTIEATFVCASSSP